MPAARGRPAGAGGARRGRHRRGRQARRAGAGARRHPRRRARAAGGPARAGQDADRALASPRRSGSTSGGCSSPPTCCPPTSPARSSTTSAAATSPSGPARSSPTCCSPTRSTGRRRRPRPRCWRRCRRSRSRSRASTYRLDPPFHVLATANPIEYEGTYPLPEAQLDRFLLRVSFGYPSADEEWEVLRRRMARRREEAELDAGRRRARRCWPCRPRWRTSRSRTRSAATSWRSPRPPASTRRCWSAPRRAARWRCCCWPGPGRRWPAATTWSPRTSRTVAVPALAHRITLRPEMWLRRVDPSFVVGEVLERDARRRPAARCPATRAGHGRAADAAVDRRRCGPPSGRRGGPTRPGRRPAWVPTRALGRAVLLTGLLLVAGVAARPGRPGRAGRPVRARHRVGAAPAARAGARGAARRRRRRTSSRAAS